MDLIKQSLSLIDKYVEKFGIEFEEENKYYSSVNGLKEYLNENDIVLNKSDREELEKFIMSLDVPNAQRIFYDILNLEWIDDDCNRKIIGIYDLTDNQILCYFSLIMSTITYSQYHDMLGLKYNIIIWNTGFHKLAKLCRGKVIDLKTKETISYPFDKFFNLNETEETSFENIEQHIKQSSYVWATEKKDGSTIIITKLKNGGLLITTNGSFENIQIDMAKEILKEKYSDFIENIMTGYTYIFELIHPENRIVLDYGQEKNLYLLAIRDLKTEKLVSLDEIHKVAEKYKFPVPEVYDFTNLETMVNLAHNMKNANKEGWVLRIGNENEEIMVKLKLDEYFAMHKTFGKVKLGWVYKHMVIGDLDDFLSLLDEKQKNEVFEKINDITTVREKIKEEVILEANLYLKEFNIKKKEFFDDRERMINIINKVFASKSNLKSFIIQYFKKEHLLDYQIEKINYKNMRPFFEKYGYNVNE